VLQSSKMLRDAKNYATNPNLKYELLEYLVTEDLEASALAEGRTRGGKSRPLR